MNNNKRDWNEDTPYYINFPLYFFARVEWDDDDCLDVDSFKTMIDKILDYGIAAKYERESSAWRNPETYDKDLFQDVLHDIGIRITNTTLDSYFNSKIKPLIKEVKEVHGTVFCGISTPILLSFLDDYKSDFECVQFLAYCAIKSILGSAWVNQNRPNVKRIPWEFILSRMAGFTNREPPQDWPPYIFYYQSKRHRAQLRKALINKWHVQIDGQSRGPGGAYYMIGDIMHIAKAIEYLQEAKKMRRKRIDDKPLPP